MTLSKYDEFLLEYVLPDKRLGEKDIEKFAAAGGSQEQAEKFVNKAEKQVGKGTLDVKVKDNASGAASNSSLFGGVVGNAEKGGTSGYSGTDIDLGAYEAMKGIDYQYQDALNQGLYNSQQIIADINASANTYMADAQRDASMYASDASVQIADITSGRGLEGTKYVADQNRLAAENVASIQGAYSLDLQTIVNAGLSDVAKIQGEYGLANTELLGEYGLESDRIKGDTARDVAQRQKDAQLFGALFGAFNFA